MIGRGDECEIQIKEDKSMYFLIDYENVNYAGLEGTEFLQKEDTVCIFFSNVSDKIVAYRMKDIEMSGCKLEICKLKNARKNALDFYIASKVGEIFATDRNAKIAIVSADNGFASVLDYWQARLTVHNQLVRSRTIAKAISFVCGENVRKKLVDERLSVLDLQTEFAKYEERNRIVNTLEDILGDTEYERYIPSIANMLVANNKPKVLYLNSLKSFGKKDGTVVYRMIRECVHAHAS